jgi:hypothetical protein
VPGRRKEKDTLTAGFIDTVIAEKRRARQIADLPWRKVGETVSPTLRLKAWIREAEGYTRLVLRQCLVKIS